MLFLRVIFIIFEVVSGLHINWRTNFIHPINEVAEVDNLAAILGGRVGELPTIYLGIPLGAKSKSKGIWNGGNEDKKKFHMVKWEVVTKSKKGGGMGIRDMKMQNRSLMMKWLWKFVTGENMLWKKVIREKYEMEDRWTTKMVVTPYGCSIWRSIKNLWPLVLSRLSFKVGNGQKVSFWKDKWIDQSPLKQLYPDIHILSLQQQATVSEMWTGQGWNFQLRRNLNDWEMDRIGVFYNTMESFNNRTGEENTIVWKIGSKWWLYQMAVARGEPVAPQGRTVAAGRVADGKLDRPDSSLPKPDLGSVKQKGSQSINGLDVQSVVSAAPQSDTPSQKQVDDSMCRPLEESTIKAASKMSGELECHQWRSLRRQWGIARRGSVTTYLRGAAIYKRRRQEEDGDMARGVPGPNQWDNAMASRRGDAQITICQFPVSHRDKWRVAVTYEIGFPVQFFPDSCKSQKGHFGLFPSL
ncbi:putative cytosolic iron-sulfur protein assembly protein Ciao1-like [Capsicum annuum]|nr:putative cytosolic iron-sulfur protein assembly protein Ciao1-like [Capsicum annuum]